MGGGGQDTHPTLHTAQTHNPDNHTLSISLRGIDHQITQNGEKGVAAWRETHEPQGKRAEGKRSDGFPKTRTGILRMSAVSAGRKLDEQTDDTKGKCPF